MLDGIAEPAVLEEVMVLSPDPTSAAQRRTACVPPQAGPPTLPTVQICGGSGVSAVEMDGHDHG